jgi:hypothetical protein
MSGPPTSTVPGVVPLNAATAEPVLAPNVYRMGPLLGYVGSECGSLLKGCQASELSLVSLQIMGILLEFPGLKGMQTVPMISCVQGLVSSQALATG